MSRARTPAACRRGAAIGTMLALSLALAALVGAPAASEAAVNPCTPPVTNPVACENTLPGTPPADWEVDGDGDPSIQGFATSFSVNKGSSVSFKIKSTTSNYHVDILRLGYYDGNGARLIASNVPRTFQTQPACLTDSSTGLIDCGNWATSATWAVPSTAVSGVYVAHLVRNDTGGDSLVPFVVRDESSHSDIVLQTSDATWEAYNPYGGNSLYTCTVACPPGNPQGYKAAYKVSYNRPFSSAGIDGGRSWLFTGAEYPMIRFLEANGYDVSYLANVDVHRRGSLLLNHKAFISSGHDEYWSKTQRTNLEAARDAGVSMAFFSGNEGFWKTRWEPSIDGSTADRTLVTYKDTHFDAPTDPVEWTGTWRDPRFGTPPNAGYPENALTGQFFMVNTGTADIMVPSQYKSLRLWRNTAAASLAAGQSLRLAPQSLGYEWDVDDDNGFRPPGLFRLSSTTVSGLQVFTDYGSNTIETGTETHNLTMYRASSGALVFGAGTVQWSWGLDDSNLIHNAPDRNMQQATVNLLADMGAQPNQLISGLVAATRSTDTAAPTTTISAPSGTLADGSTVTVSGTATDTGGVVAGVEVSTDDGKSWHPATGTTNWTYSWVVHGSPSTAIRSRAVDDSGNLETPSAGRAINVTCPCSLFGSTVPGTADSGDQTPTTVGVKFKTDSFGTISGIRFYKGSTNTGAHIGSLWSADGTLLAQATFTSETASGWQNVNFSSPVAVQANTTYVASYFAPNGHYAATSGFLYPLPGPTPQSNGSVDSPPLHVLRSSGSTTNGVYAYNSTSTFPTETFQAANYWVDVNFAPAAAPGPVTNVAATADFGSAKLTWSAPTSGGVPTSYTVTPFIGSTAQTPTTISRQPLPTSAAINGLTAGTSYTFKVQASNPTGAGPQSASSNAVTPQAPTAPTAPTGVSAQAASSRALVSWTAPASDGGQSLTGYTIRPFIGPTAQTPVQVSASTTSATITGLTNGTSYTFTVTATNSIGTSAQSSASNTVTPQDTIFDLATPGTIDSGDPNAVELGVKFRADANGTVTGIRFYKATANTGTHVGSLWTTGGTRLAQATFTGESSSGWQTATFATPVAVTANTTYVASYFAPNGHYSATAAGLSTAIDNPPLHTLANSTTPNGVYTYAGTPSFPNNTFNSSNYWIDVTYRAGT